MTIDPRLMERRKTVAEEKAHHSMRRLLRFLIVLLTLGALVWLALSPGLSVTHVRTAGIVSSDAHAALARQDVVVGTPMVFVRTAQVEEALELDPWVQEARVELDWPNEVLVRVTERVPVLWVESSQGWTWRAVDGVAVTGPEAPDEASPRLLVPELAEVELDGSLLVKGAAEFVDALPEELRRDLSIWLSEGELWTDAAGYQVRLGRPVEMQAKALTLMALLSENVPAGATLILVAPTNPAVLMAGAEGERSGESGEGDDVGSGEGETGAADQPDG